MIPLSRLEHALLGTSSVFVSIYLIFNVNFPRLGTVSGVMAILTFLLITLHAFVSVIGVAFWNHDSDYVRLIEFPIGNELASLTERSRKAIGYGLLGFIVSKTIDLLIGSETEIEKRKPVKTEKPLRDRSEPQLREEVKDELLLWLSLASAVTYVIIFLSQGIEPNQEPQNVVETGINLASTWSSRASLSSGAPYKAGGSLLLGYAAASAARREFNIMYLGRTAGDQYASAARLFVRQSSGAGILALGYLTPGFAIVIQMVVGAIPGETTNLVHLLSIFIFVFLVGFSTLLISLLVFYWLMYLILLIYLIRVSSVYIDMAIEIIGISIPNVPSEVVIFVLYLVFSVIVFVNWLSRVFDSEYISSS